MEADQQPGHTREQQRWQMNAEGLPSSASASYSALKTCGQPKAG